MDVDSPQPFSILPLRHFPQTTRGGTRRSRPTRHPLLRSRGRRSVAGSQRARPAVVAFDVGLLSKKKKNTRIYSYHSIKKTVIKIIKDGIKFTSESPDDSA